MIRSVLSASTAGGGGPAGYSLGPEVLLVLADDGTARVVDLDGDVLALDSIGARMLEETLRRGQEAAGPLLAQEFSAPTDEVAADLRAFLADFEHKGLIESGAQPRRVKRSVQKACSSAVGPALRLVQSAAPRSLQARTWLTLPLAFGAVRLFGWPNTVRAWTAPNAIRPTRRDRLERGDDRELVDAISATVIGVMARHPLRLDCKERALCAWALARCAGLPANLVVGISLTPLALHVWCESNGVVIADQFDGYCDRYTHLRAYP